MIALRILSWGENEIESDWLRNRIRQADALRVRLGYTHGDRPGYRVVFGEADALPGLVVDRYADTLVFQVATVGMDLLRDEIVATLDELFSPTCVIERSDLATRKEERLDERITLHKGKVTSLPRFEESGLHFLADPIQGQKTGFFLDQRALRDVVRRVSSGLRVLNLCSYTGAFGICALVGGANRVTQVDSSERAHTIAREIAQENGIRPTAVEYVCEDVFQWLSAQSEAEYDMVILDPPALIKARSDLEAGMRGYHFLNRAALRLVASGGLFVTSSCSAHLHEGDFVELLTRASHQANCSLQIVAREYQAGDHPVIPEFPEGAYLKSLVCAVRR